MLYQKLFYQEMKELENKAKEITELHDVLMFKSDAKKIKLVAEERKNHVLQKLSAERVQNFHSLIRIMSVIAESQCMDISADVDHGCGVINMSGECLLFDADLENMYMKEFFILIPAFDLVCFDINEALQNVCLRYRLYEEIPY